MTAASEILLEHGSRIVDAVVTREFDRHPELLERYGATGREKALQDARFHVSFLAQALAVGDPGVFADYTAWAKVVLVNRKVLASDLAFHLECLAEVLGEVLPGDTALMASRYVTAAAQAIPEMPDDLPDIRDQHGPLSALAHQYFGALIRGERASASKLVLGAVAEGTPIKEIYLHVFEPAQHELGRLWQTNRISVAQEHYCTAATQLIMSQLYERVFASATNGHTMVATCVAENLHELGVRMVADFFEMDGWDTYYLGANAPHAAVLDAVADRGAEVLAVSAALAPQVQDVRDLIRAARARTETRAVTVLVGGHPFNRDVELWRRVGADGYAPNAQAAIEFALQTVAAKSS